MKFKLRINGKMLLYVLGTTLVIYISGLSYAAFMLRSNSYENAHQILEAKTIEISNDANNKLNSYLEPINILAQAFSNYQEIPEPNRRVFFTEMLFNLITKNTDFSSVWTIWEPGSIDAFDEAFINPVISNSLGNFAVNYYRDNETILLDTSIEKLSSVLLESEVYQLLKNTQVPVVTEPEVYEYKQTNSDKVLIIKMGVPIIVNNQFLGVVGIDVPIEYMQQNYSKLKPMGNGTVYIITYSGEFLAHNEPEFIGKLFEEYAPDIDVKYSVQQIIREGMQTEFIAEEPLSGEKTIFRFRPIVIGDSERPWSLGVSVPLDTFYLKANRTFTFVVFVGLIGLIILSLVIIAIARTITYPLRKTTQVLEEISRGNIRNVEKMQFTFNDEINDMAAGMNNVIEGLNSAAMFAQQIGEGYLNVDYNLLSEKDALGTSLIAMRESLIAAKKAEEQKRIEDEKRNWVTHGLAKFGEIIRQHNDDMDKFTMNITKNIVDYMGSAQVAMYINQQIEDENEDKDVYELKAVIAYGKPVMLNKTFEKGRELLGRVVSENKTLYLENLPERYVMLSPGMHEKRKPNNLLIVPLHINDNTLGVIELLAFDKFELHHIDFIEKLCENIASVVASVKTNLRTEKLLEQSQQQADELAQHEEEMRQNLEEMEATQEEANKRQNELNSYLKAVKSSIMSAELDIQGRILDISPAMSVVYGATTENMRGKYYETFVAYDNTAKNEFTEFWETLLRNGASKRKQKITNRNKTTWILESYMLIKKDGLPPKVLIVAVDKTKEREVIDMLNAELKAHKLSS
jgi:PAS domain S-box-containing protein